jgi:hypothetical protein
MIVDELSIPNLDDATNDPDELVHLATALSVLAAYADCKAIAMRFRLVGEIEKAQRSEKRCEMLFDMLPSSWRW